MKIADNLNRAFDACDEETCAQILLSNPELVDATSSDGLPYVRSAIHRESHGQPPGMSQLFLKSGSAVDVFTAAALGDSKAVERHVDENPARLHATDAWGMQPLHWAAHCGHAEVVGVLLTRGADVNHPADSWTALHLAVEIGHEDVAQLLVENGADLHARLDEAHDRMTPLEMAKSWKVDHMVSFLEPFYG